MKERFSLIIMLNSLGGELTSHAALYGMMLICRLMKECASPRGPSLEKLAQANGSMP